MLARTYYSDRQIEVTDETVGGPRGVFRISEVVGVEARLPTPQLAVAALIGVGLMMLSSVVHGRAFYGLLAVQALDWLAILGLCFQRSVVLRTSGGAVALGVLRDAGDRRKIADAVMQAKCPA